MQKYNQVTGGGCRLVLYRETAPGKLDSADQGVVISFVSEGFAAPPNKQGSAVITGKRGQGKPVPQTPDYQGNVQMAPYAPLMGHMLRALCGAPVTTAEAPHPLGAIAVTDEGGGAVGIACPGHGFVQDTVISITGTVNYDGIHRLEYGTTADKLVVKSLYTPEIIPADAFAHRGLVAALEGDAREVDGHVGLPVAGIGVALNAGEKITISGTTNYEGEYVLMPGTSPRLLVIEKLFEAETFDGTAFAAPHFFRHEFALPKKQPTCAVEKYLDYDAGAAQFPYTLYSFSKVNGISFPFGGQGELTLAIDFAVGFADARPGPVKASPVTLPSAPFYDRDTALWLDGERMGDIESGNVSLAYGIEPKSAVGDLGRRSRMPEGDPVCTVTLQAFLEHDEYQRLSDMAATVPFSLSMSGSAGEEFWLAFPEAELDTGGAPIGGKGGVSQEITVTAFVEQAPTANKFTIINRVASYA